MATTIEVKVPDIGGFKDVNVIDVLVKDGQQVDKETPLVTIETEKAAMDVPSPVAGKIAQVKLKTGDKVSEGSLILTLEAAGGHGALRWLVDGRPLAPAVPRRALYWRPDGLGFAQLTVIDAQGRSARATVRLAQ